MLFVHERKVDGRLGAFGVEAARGEKISSATAHSFDSAFWMPAAISSSKSSGAPS